jgi:hypothetical protein
VPFVCVQFQPNRAPGATTQILEAFRQAIPSAQISDGNEDERHFNITFDVASASDVLPRLHPILHSPTLGHLARSSCIVTCQGKHGWDDYLLLHHFDRTLIHDTPPTNTNAV